MLELKPPIPIVHVPATGEETAVTVKFVAAGAGVAIDAKLLQLDVPVTVRLCPKLPVQPAWPAVKL